MAYSNTGLIVVRILMQPFQTGVRTGEGVIISKRCETFIIENIAAPICRSFLNLPL